MEASQQHTAGLAAQHSEYTWEGTTSPHTLSPEDSSSEGRFKAETVSDTTFEDTG